MKPNAFLDLTQDEFQSVYGTVYAPDFRSKNITSQLTHPA
jgi:hypothetical protein